MIILVQALASVAYIALVVYPALGLLGVYKVPFIPERFVKKTDNVFVEMLAIVVICGGWLVLVSFLM